MVKKKTLLGFDDCLNYIPHLINVLIHIPHICTHAWITANNNEFIDWVNSRYWLE